jgi:LEA14-like dessication related protein
MKISSVVKIGAIGVGVLWLLNAVGLGAIATTLNFYVKGLDTGNGGLILKLAIQNPRSAGFVVKSLVATIYINNNEIGNVSMYEPVYVLPNSETVLNLTIRTGIISILSNVYDIWKGNTDLDAVVTVVGNANINDNVLPVSISYKRSA